MIRFLQTPSRAKKAVLGGMLLIICAAMVITLVPGGFLGDAFGFGTPQGVLAKVGDQEVTLVEAQQMARSMGKQQFPRGVPQQLMPFLVQRAVENLILQKAMLSEADRMGLRVSDDELRDALHQGQFGQMLFPNGQFIGQQRYEDFIQQSFGLSVPQFEVLLKTDLTIRKLRTVVEGGVTVSDEQVKQEYQRRNTKVKFEYAVLSLDDVTKQIRPTEAELKAFYEKNKNNYASAIPEKRKAQYILIDTAKLKAKAPVTPDDLKRYYNAHQDEFRVPEQVKVRHILIKTPPPGPDGKPDAKAVDAARAKAEDVLKKLKSGGNFAELAKKISEDPGSAKEGGELGWIGRGRTVPEFEKAAWSLEKGQTSGVVQSSYGFHIIHLEDKQQAHLKTLDEVKAQIEPIVAADKAARESEALANTVQSEARTTGMANAASKRGLELANTPLFTRSDALPAVGNAPQFNEAIFAAQLKNQPEMVKLAQGYAVFQVTEVKPPATPGFEEIKARVEEDFKRERAMGVMGQKMQELADRARAEHNLKKAAAEVGASVKTSELVTMTQQVPEVGALSGPASVVFDMKPGEISAPISAGRSGVVLQLVEKQEPASADFDKSKDEIREGLLAQKREQSLEMFAFNLRQQMEKQGKIRINKEEMKRLAPSAS